MVAVFERKNGLIDYYNSKRIKQKLAGMSSVQYRIHTSQTSCILLNSNFKGLVS